MGPTILFDGLNLASGTGTGIATYARNLIEVARAAGYRAGVIYSVPARLPAGSNWSDEVLAEPSQTVQGRLGQAVEWAGVRLSLFERLALTEPRPVSLPFRAGKAGGFPPCDEVRLGRSVFRRARLHFETHGRLAQFITSPRPAIAHFTAPISATFPGASNIYTIHDLVPLRVPGAIGGSRETYLRLHTEIARKADHIVTVSEASRRDIIELLGVSPERVTNTYQSVSVPAELRSMTGQEVEINVAEFGLERGRYLLFFGAIEPKKNVERLLEAYLSSGLNMPLVIVSSSGWHNAAELTIINDPAYHDNGSGNRQRGPRLKPVQFVTREALVSLIKGSRAVAFPSLYEGFGLPVLEAMLLGAPVLTSDVASLPEVAGDAALLVDPTDVETIRRGLVALAFDDDLCAELSRRGVAQAERFSSDRYRERVTALYSKLGFSSSAEARFQV